MNKHCRLVVTTSLFVISLLSLNACTTGRYQHSQDFVPNPILDPASLADAEIKVEPLSSMGNPKAYTVLGKEYQVMRDANGFKETGDASWYGMKFHGHATSNGEIYDVYQMTAAHKTLPIPSYVKVTRIDNKKSVVVRVNDRGPFHAGRIVDLSYAAAVKLGIHKTGIAAVSLEVISTPQQGPVKWLQVSALSTELAATSLQQKLAAIQPWPVVVQLNEGKTLYKVRIGPIPEGQETDQVMKILQQNQLPEPLILAAHQL